jgi:hypothetical protein
MGIALPQEKAALSIYPLPIGRAAFTSNLFYPHHTLVDRDSRRAFFSSPAPCRRC